MLIGTLVRTTFCHVHAALMQVCLDYVTDLNYAAHAHALSMPSSLQSDECLSAVGIFFIYFA